MHWVRPFRGTDALTIRGGMRKLLSSPYWVYLLLGWPAWPVLSDLIYGDRYYAEMMHITGVMSVRLVVLSLAITPILIVIRRIGHGQEFGRWLLRARRHIGLLAFYYAALHLIRYLVEMNWDGLEILLQALDVELWTGWVGFAALLLLAITSNDMATRTLGRKWKSLHQWIYPAAVLIWAHWWFYEFFPSIPFWWAMALAIIKAPQIWRAFKQS